ncbi:hypothetical protein, partial [Phascolarctobacterium succinatutens]|uniref:hypothetical protein n=1 Tax=Phascolarctobacterium succinatutens TaxID=626940 RepID=UPI003FD7552F
DFALAVSLAVEKEKLDANMPVFLADMERLGIKKFPDNANKYSSKYRRIGNINLYQYEETKEKIPKKTAGVYYEATYPKHGLKSMLWLQHIMSCAKHSLKISRALLSSEKLYIWEHIVLLYYAALHI